ncbi:hypothetical protein B0H10DRAFT_1974659 [Mycena sp. CBHHK59/15]|nr:hypothetical protein B0H10DRAFT_1974659 [Mycena sp. CBHHK59/15]
MSLIQRTTSALLVAGRIVTCTAELDSSHVSGNPQGIMEDHIRVMMGKKGAATDQDAISEICAIGIAWPSKFSTAILTQTTDQQICGEIVNLCNWDWQGPQNYGQTIHPQSDHPSANFSGNLQPVCTIVVESIVQDQDYATVGRELCDVGFHQFLHCRLAILPQITHWQISQRDCKFVQLAFLWPPKFSAGERLPANMQHWLEAIQMQATPDFNAADHPFSL